MTGTVALFGILGGTDHSLSCPGLLLSYRTSSLASALGSQVSSVYGCLMCYHVLGVPMRLPAFMSLAFSWELQCRREATDGTTGVLPLSLNVCRHDLRADNFNSIYRKYV